MLEGSAKLPKTPPQCNDHSVRGQSLMNTTIQPIFAIDDDEDHTNLLQIMLHHVGILNPLTAYRDAEKAFAALAVFAHEQAVPLLCFLDMKFPTISGHDILRWIRGQRFLDTMPVVMLSASHDPDDVRTAGEIGAQCFVAKYPHSDVLFEIICDAERWAMGLPVAECFRMPANLLLPTLDS
jgi:CheY-like chemotaxis protein